MAPLAQPRRCRRAHRRPAPTLPDRRGDRPAGHNATTAHCRNRGQPAERSGRTAAAARPGRSPNPSARVMPESRHCWPKARAFAVSALNEQPTLHSFVRGLRRDQDAVTAGLTLPWSSGTVEGHINRINMLKRRTAQCWLTRACLPRSGLLLSSCPVLLLPDLPRRPAVFEVVSGCRHPGSLSARAGRRGKPGKKSCTYARRREMTISAMFWAATSGSSCSQTRITSHPASVRK